MSTLRGYHGTSLAAARRILRCGWDAIAAEWLATPRIRTGPEWVYAVWPTLEGRTEAEALAVARGWAVEACERHGLPRPYAGAVLLVETDDRAVSTPWAEPVARSADVRFVRLVTVGHEPEHGHPWPASEVVTLACRLCWTPELVWRSPEEE